jgi:hypothetical protein
MKANPGRFWRVWVPSGALSVGGLAAFLGACCGVPWLVAAIGVTGAIAVARIAFVAPYLWVLAFAASITALIWAYRAEPMCAAACTPTQRRGRLIGVWVVALTLLGLFIAVGGWHSFVF